MDNDLLTPKQLVATTLFTVLFVLLTVGVIGFGLVSFSKWSNHEYSQRVEYANENPKITFIDKNTREIHFNRYSTSEGRSSFLINGNYEIISASKNDNGAAMYIVKVKK